MLITIAAVIAWTLIWIALMLTRTGMRTVSQDRRRASSAGAIGIDVPIEKRHYYGTLTDDERGPVCFLASQLISRPGSSAIWHGTKLEERITIVAPRENA